VAELIFQPTLNFFIAFFSINVKNPDRARRHSRFHPAVLLAGYPTSKINKIKATLNL